MTAPKHTPGPWVAVEADAETPAPAGLLIAVYRAGAHADLAVGPPICDMRAAGDVRGSFAMEETNANARLIAAAPQMLEYLKGLLDIIERDERQRHPVPLKAFSESLRKIVAKAEA